MMPAVAARGAQDGLPETTINVFVDGFAFFDLEEVSFDEVAPHELKLVNKEDDFETSM